MINTEWAGIKPRLIRNCRLSPAAGGALLVPEGMIRLNGSALEIVRRCDGQKTFAEILSELHEKFTGKPGQPSPDQIDLEAVAFLRQLRDKRVIEF